MRLGIPLAWAGVLSAMVVAGAGLAVLAGPAPPAAPPEAPVPPDLRAQVDQATRDGVRYLVSRLDGKTGRCLDEADPRDPRFGARTALVASALLAGGADRQQPPLSTAIGWLAGAELHGTAAVAWRTTLLAALDDPQWSALLERDGQWLIRAAGADGGYTHTSLDGRPSDAADNFNSHLAVLAVDAARQRGLAVGTDYWQRVWTHWVTQQQGDGGWGYRLAPGQFRTHSYGSMTAAGLAAMLVAQERLDRFEVGEYGALSPSRPVGAAQQWLADHFTAAQNPGKGVQYHFQWLYAVSRAGRLSGAKRLGGVDWYAAGAAELLSQRNGDGSFGRADRPPDTGLAVMFLSAGSGPVVAGKLHYTGRWNSRPGDLAMLSGYLGRALERRFGWQIVDADGGGEDFDDAPIVYLSGSGPIELSDQQIARLRQYALRGGMIVSEATASNGDFTLDMRGIYRRMFPQLELARLDQTHPVHSLHFDASQVGGLMAVSNGVRLLALHSPRDLSTALQASREGPEARLLANVYLYATDRAGSTGRPAVDWPARSDRPAQRRVSVARVKHEGNADPEPLAWERLAIEAHNVAGIDLDVSEPMDPARLDAARWPVAVMSGTRDFRLGPADSAAMSTYLQDGGTLIVEAVGGSEEFAAAARRELFGLVAGAVPRPLDSDLALKGPWPVDQIAWRRDFSATLGAARTRLRFQALHLGDPAPRAGGGMPALASRPAIIFSGEDLTAGLLGVPGFALRGYAPATARAIMTNLLANLQ